MSWISYLYERISGLELGSLPPDTAVMPPSRDRQAFPEFYAEDDQRFLAESKIVQFLGAKGVEKQPVESSGGPTVWLCTGPIEYEETSAIERDIANLKAARDQVDVEDAFLPVVAPASVYWLHNRYYATDEEFVFAVADALRNEYRAIVDSGLLLQVDDAVLVHEYDSILSLGGSVEDYRRWAQVRVDALNHALKGIPEDRVRYHVCWGSWHGPHVFDPPLTEVVDLVLQVRARYYSIEQANARHEHEWRVWENVKLPEGKVLIPGDRHPPHERGGTPGAGGRAARPPRQAGRCARASWAARTAASPRAPTCGGSTRRSSGRSCKRSPRERSSPRRSSGVVSRRRCEPWFQHDASPSGRDARMRCTSERL